MKDGISDIIGKTISDVVIANKDSEPKLEVFLVFSDGTYFEFWGNSFTGAGGVNRGGLVEVSDYVKSMGARITEVYPANKLGEKD